MRETDWEQKLTELLDIASVSLQELMCGSAPCIEDSALDFSHRLPPCQHICTPTSAQIDAQE